MITNLDFLNKNLFRNYPIQQNATATSINGNVLPTFIISSISLSIPTVENAIDYQPYISQVSIINSTLSIAISVVNIFSSSTTTAPIGYFTGVITNDFQTLALTNFDGLSSGFLITGQASSILGINGIFAFNSPTQTGLEISTYIVFTPPGVSSLNYREQKLTGKINFGQLLNITEANVSNTCSFAVKDNSSILSLGDKSSQFRNCDTPVITNINTIVPYPEDGYADDGNIYIFGIEPVVFTIDNTTASLIASTPTIDLTQFCVLNGTNLPPTNPNYLVNQMYGDFIGIENYYSKSETPVVNFLYEPLPEYTYWPQYVLTYSIVLPFPTASTGNIIISPTGIKGIISQVYATIDVGTASFTVKISGTPITGLTDIEVANTGTFTVSSVNYTANGLVALATGANSFGTTDVLTFDILGVTGAPTTFSLTVFYTQIFN